MNNNQSKAKAMFSNAFKKVGDLGKKTVEGAKSFAEQTQKNIHDKQAQKYTPVTQDDFNSADFQIPSIITIEENFTNKEFVDSENAIGWIEQHKDVPVLHMYVNFVDNSGLTFVPFAQKDDVYCVDKFKTDTYITAREVFGKATKEKLAELSNIAFILGAKSCSVEILEAESEINSGNLKLGIKGIGALGGGGKNASSNKQSGKNITNFEGHDNPQVPDLKWFEHDDNIKWLIEMRCKRAIKSNILELKGSSSATISKSIACAMDDVLGAKVNLSMENEALKEYDDILVFEIEF